MRQVSSFRLGFWLVSVCAAFGFWEGLSSARSGNQAKQSSNKTFLTRISKLIKGTAYEDPRTLGLLRDLSQKSRQLPRHVRGDLLHDVEMRFQEEISNYHGQKTLMELTMGGKEPLGWMNASLHCDLRKVDEALLPEHRFLRSTLKDFPLKTAQDLSRAARDQKAALGIGSELTLRWLDRFLRDHPELHGNVDEMLNRLPEKMSHYYNVMAAQ